MKSKSSLYKTVFCSGKKKFVPLVDPDKYTSAGIKKVAMLAEKAGVACIFYGGSLVIRNRNRDFITILKEHTSVPIVLFPGNQYQVHEGADGILLLSLISGRNPEMLIGNHVIAAPVLRDSGLEILPTGYMLIDGGRPTAVSYISGTAPIPHDKDEIAGSTALAGEMLGLRLIYLDCGSGAEYPPSVSMVRKIRETVSLPLIVGGGIRSAKQAMAAWKAGADIVVVGNAIESNPGLITQIAETLKK